MAPRLAVAMAGLAFLVAAACGGETADRAAPTTAPQPTTPATTPPTESPEPSPLVVPEDCNADGSALEISAQDAFWVLPGRGLVQPGEACLAAPAGPFTLTLHNDVQGKGIGPVPHNFSIYTDTSVSDALFRGDNVLPGDSKTYRVSAIDPGTYFFRCDLHPQFMTGVLVVE